MSIKPVPPPSMLARVLDLQALDRPTLADLDPYLRDPEAAVREAAVHVLGRLLHTGDAPRGAADTLAWTLADPDLRVREAAARTLDDLPEAVVGTDGVEALLLAAAPDRDGRVRGTATALLDALVRAATELYAQGLQEDEPHIRVQAVLGLVTLRAAAEVAEAADDPAREVRVAVAGGLARLAEDAALPEPAPSALDHLLCDHDPVVRMAAIDAVGELGAPEPLVGRVVTATAHTSWQVRRRAALALAFAAPDVAVQPLVRALRDRIVDVRRAAVQSLEQWVPTHPEVLTALTEALSDSDPGVRTQARWALSS
ncbi:HEAT repeat domain-containing protein [Actinomadura oligospora]|uniref:HEAT repeat domain-containing protein n=1 Tax=Actinomadura oligospora TaxID=111804 RepID=UPI0004B567DF|nr:HEAT repeat domain-containing protein [Actinomadura oligospora]